MDLIGSIKKLKHITELSTDILDRMLHLSLNLLYVMPVVLSLKDSIFQQLILPIVRH